jgi:hypothetical protein
MGPGPVLTRTCELVVAGADALSAAGGDMGACVAVVEVQLVVVEVAGTRMRHICGGSGELGPATGAPLSF